MKWEEFLNHPKVKSMFSQNLNQSVGDYLYKKMLHDMLECLNGYKGFIKIASSTGNIPDNIQRWFSKWTSSNEAWTANLTSIAQNHYQIKDVFDDMDWPILLNELAKIPDEIALQNNEAQELTIPSGEPLEGLIKGAVESIARLNLICNYIEQQDYISLFMPDNKGIDT